MVSTTTTIIIMNKSKKLTQKLQKLTKTTEAANLFLGDFDNIADIEGLGIVDDGSLAIISELGIIYTYNAETNTWSSSNSQMPTFGFMDYNDTTGPVTLVADTWTDLPNNGAGAFTNKTYKLKNVNEVIDTDTGYLDFTDLTLGSEVSIRNDFSVTPNTNNSLLEVRYILGSGLGEYSLLVLSERLDNGSGIAYQKVPIFNIYMGDSNTKDNPGKLQVKLSTSGTVDNAGSYISIKLK